MFPLTRRPHINRGGVIAERAGKLQDAIAMPKGLTLAAAESRANLGVFLAMSARRFAANDTQLEWNLPACLENCRALSGIICIFQPISGRRKPLQNTTRSKLGILYGI